LPDVRRDARFASESTLVAAASQGPMTILPEKISIRHLLLR
jgi:hypothetical protein